MFRNFIFLFVSALFACVALPTTSIAAASAVGAEATEVVTFDGFRPSDPQTPSPLPLMGGLVVMLVAVGAIGALGRRTE